MKFSTSLPMSRSIRKTRVFVKDVNPSEASWWIGKIRKSSGNVLFLIHKNGIYQTAMTKKSEVMKYLGENK